METTQEMNLLYRSSGWRAGMAGAGMGWQKASGYNRRALAEATIGRFKRVIGDGLRARTDQRQAAEMTVAVLNRMLELGRPKSVRIT